MEDTAAGAVDDAAALDAGPFRAIVDTMTMATAPDATRTTRTTPRRSGRPRARQWGRGARGAHGHGYRTPSVAGLAANRIGTVSMRDSTVNGGIGGAPDGHRTAKRRVWPAST